MSSETSAHVRLTIAPLSGRSWISFAFSSICACAVIFGEFHEDIADYMLMQHTKGATIEELKAKLDRVSAVKVRNLLGELSLGSDLGRADSGPLRMGSDLSVENMLHEDEDEDSSRYWIIPNTCTVVEHNTTLMPWLRHPSTEPAADAVSSQGPDLTEANPNQPAAWEMAELIDRRKPKTEDKQPTIADPQCPMFSSSGPAAEAPVSSSNCASGSCTCCVHEAENIVRAPSNSSVAGASDHAAGVPQLSSLEPFPILAHATPMVMPSQEAAVVSMTSSSAAPSVASMFLQRNALDVRQMVESGIHAQFAGTPDFAAMPLPELFELNVAPCNSVNAEMIGRLGEETVAKHLQEKYGAARRVVWLNAETETGSWLHLDLAFLGCWGNLFWTRSTI